MEVDQKSGAKPEIDKVHVSMNRRIDMPPDFHFPEGAAPPSDLIRSHHDPQSFDATDKINMNDVMNTVNNNDIKTDTSNIKLDNSDLNETDESFEKCKTGT